jgi:hypothetical protein
LNVNLAGASAQVKAADEPGRLKAHQYLVSEALGSAQNPEKLKQAIFIGR